MLVYILAEERSGSTWVANQLASQLNRSRAYIEIDQDKAVNDRRLSLIQCNPAPYRRTDKVYHTHLFQIVEVADWLKEPLFIKTTRRDALDQLLSYFIAVKKVSNFPNLTVDEPITVTAEEIQSYFARKVRNLRHWDACRLHNKQTIVYEDLFAGVAIPALETTLRFEPRRPKPDKAQYFANLDDVKEQVFKQGWF